MDCHLSVTTDSECLRSLHSWAKIAGGNGFPVVSRNYGEDGCYKFITCEEGGGAEVVARGACNVLEPPEENEICHPRRQTVVL